MTEYCEKTFTTTMLLDSFRKLALRTCKLPHWVSLEGRDRAQTPNTLIIGIVFSSIEDRDRFTIAMRFAEDERAAIAEAAPKPAPRRASAAGQYVPA